jgi:putative endonuclease
VIKSYYIYALTSDNKNTLYIGITNNLERRLFEHKNGLCGGFTKKYHCVNLLYYEQTSSIESAILREKQIKRWSREKKLVLIKMQNPDLLDLSTTLEMTNGEEN